MTDTETFPPARPLDELTGSERTQYLSLPVADRLNGAAAFVGAMAFLHDNLGFIHCDLNPPNVWVNPATGEAVVTDLDSGYFLNGGAAGTFGKLGDCLAPEIAYALAQGGMNAPVSVTEEAERWSVAILVSHLIFLAHPLFFLNVIALNAIQNYTAKNIWPDANPTDPHFNPANAAAHHWLLTEASLLPASVTRLFQTTLADGAAIPAQRPTAETWRRVLTGPRHSPVVTTFHAD